MSQTDRQTDKPATHWKSAIFDSGVDSNGVSWSGQWASLEPGALPAFVKTVYKQKEICPDTQREHFQVHIVCHRQVRLTQMSGWIKRTKWFAVIGDKHIKNSIAYTSKKESAVEGTHEVVQGEKYYQIHELLQLIAKEYDHAERPSEASQSSEMERALSFETLSSRLVWRDVKWVNKLANPQLKKLWDMYKWVFIAKMWEHLDDTGGAYIIEGPASEDIESEEYLIE